jgi:hypothetical protein
MKRMDPSDLAVRTVLREAAVDLHNIALTVDRASAVLDPTLELLEASHAIHRALVLMVDWNSEHTDGRRENPPSGSTSMAPGASPNLVGAQNEQGTRHLGQ